MEVVSVQDVVTAAAVACTEHWQAFETLQTLLSNILVHPQEEKYRSVSMAVLAKRGLNPQCIAVLNHVGFQEEHGRLCFQSDPDHSSFGEAWAAVDFFIQQKNMEQEREVATADAKRCDDAHAVEVVGCSQSPTEAQISGFQEDLLFECPICFCEQDTYGWSCPNGHMFCSGCMRHHVDAVAFPRCPSCDYELGEGDLTELDIPEERLVAFKNAKLQGAVDTLAADGECLVRCSRADCPNAVVISSGTGRQEFVCSMCDAEPFCTGCRQTPYHHHTACNAVQPLREQWLRWLQGGREEYHGRQRNALESDRRNQALYEAIERHKELEADERWKAKHCRLCPGCSRPISKIEGCDSMVCGRSYHGGDQQPGCGLEFNWATAKKYEVRIEQTHQTPAAAPSRLRGRHAFHPFTACCLCGSDCISGVRFRCIHCPAFDVCGSCEPKLVDVHPADHVFEILFESDFRCPWLPRGTRVTMVRSGDKLPRSLTRCWDRGQLEGQVGKVIARRRPPLEGYSVELDLGQGTVEVEIEHLEPIIASRAEAEALLTQTLEQDSEQEPAAPRQQLQLSDSEEEAMSVDSGSDEELAFGRHQAVRNPVRQPAWDFADDSPLSEAEEEAPLVRRPNMLDRPPRRVRPRRAQPGMEGGYRLGSGSPRTVAGQWNGGGYRLGSGSPRTIAGQQRGPRVARENVRHAGNAYGV
eukprot:gnl/MRDRNA2_/MRDRNA2_98406_c0_seq1.p1 gnl/MRDRNA2_/MRDRNA2_98406_c0~~gnl/MRDRNA2_/MRDRNA2_98406_c0_seq1.p1  ORF type:complete len:697 (+),score=123.68 gnl/MRDRNA2_/MRDRNA2_98406_c0_seq1:103-2193(+)